MIERPDYEGLHISGISMQGLNLCEARMAYVYAELTSFVHADLRGADLRFADLRQADLAYTDLRGADLRWARLDKTRFTGARLSGADFRWAEITSNTDMSDAREKSDATFQPVKFR